MSSPKNHRLGAPRALGGAFGAIFFLLALLFSMTFAPTPTDAFVLVSNKGEILLAKSSIRKFP